MNSGDAAEQVVRMSLEGVEVVAKIAGAAAREVAAFLLAALKSGGDKGDGEPLKIRGKERLASMLKSGKPLEIFSVPEGSLQAFYKGAKQYGIVYCVLKQKGYSADGLCDVMVRAEDAPRVNRLVERLKFATVSRAAIESEVVSERADPAATTVDAADTADTPELNDVEQLLEGVFGEEKDKAAPEAARADAPDAPEVSRTGAGKPTPEKRERGEATPPNPKRPRPPRGARARSGAARRGSRPQSEPISSDVKPPVGRNTSKPSVNRELGEIVAEHARRGAGGGRTGRGTSIMHIPLMPEDGDVRTVITKSEREERSS